MTGEPEISEVAAMLADRSRLAMLSALADGKALPAGELARLAHVSPQTASSHLSRMLEAGMLRVESQGRHRYYGLASDHLKHVLESMAVIAPARKPLTMLQNEAADRLRFARTCYGHLAGVLGVGLAEKLMSRRYLENSDAGWILTRAGERWFRDFGIPIDSLRSARRPLIRTCLDWSERRYHVAGALGDALANRCFELGWLARVRQSRAVRLTDRGSIALKERFGLSL